MIPRNEQRGPSKVSVKVKLPPGVSRRQAEALADDALRCLAMTNAVGAKLIMLGAPASMSERESMGVAQQALAVWEKSKKAAIAAKVDPDLMFSALPRAMYAQLVDECAALFADEVGPIGPAPGAPCTLPHSLILHLVLASGAAYPGMASVIVYNAIAIAKQAAALIVGCEDFQITRNQIIFNVLDEAGTVVDLAGEPVAEPRAVELVEVIELFETHPGWRDVAEVIAKHVVGRKTEPDVEAPPVRLLNAQGVPVIGAAYKPMIYGPDGAEASGPGYDEEGNYNGYGDDGPC